VVIGEEGLSSVMTMGSKGWEETLTAWKEGKRAERRAR
jgi:hypothetical protein